jgi:hypothetical protein
MWLPLWFTFERNVTTSKILSGEYANIRLWRGGLGQVTDAGNWVAPAGIEPGSDTGEALTNQWRRPADVASPSTEIRPGEPWLWEFPATCFYTAQFLTDLLGTDAPPFGLMTVPVGGTMLEEWSAPETQAAVKNVTCMCMDSKTCDPFGPLGPQCTKNSDLYYGNVQPFVNVTVKMWLWYQVRCGLGARAAHLRRYSNAPSPSHTRDARRVKTTFRMTVAILHKARAMERSSLR